MLNDKTSFETDNEAAGAAAGCGYINRVKAKLERAERLNQAGRTDEAIAIYQQLLREKPDNPAVLYELAITHHGRGELDKAVAAYQHVLALDSSHYYVHFNLGNALRNLGQHEAAIDSYQRSLLANPAHVDTLHNLGTAFFITGELEDAAICFKCVVAHDPDYAAAHYNLGLIHFEQGRLAEAVASYTGALNCNPADVDTHFNLALAYKEMDAPDKAVSSLKRALELEPADAELHYHLGRIYKDLHELDQAAACIGQAVALAPDNGEMHTGLGVVYHVQGRNEEAIACYRQAIALGHDVHSAEHLLAALTGRTTAVAPRQYVIDIFDNYAPRFEHELVADLQYDVPCLLRRLLDSHRPAAAGFANALDLGCGTGLAGLAFRPAVRRLTGVDLSRNMIGKAREKKIYDALHQADFADFLHKTREDYDLFIAADVIIYLGNLESLFRSIADRARPAARFLFSTESCEGDGYVLQPSGRYAHSAAYIEDLARRHGFVVEGRNPAGIRKEMGQWIMGDLVILRYGAPRE